MSDRYLFRGQDLNTGEWIEGDIVARSEGCTYIGQLEFPEYDDGSIGCGVEDEGCSDRYEGAEYGYALCEGEMLQNVIACNPETVGQCTGLKDRNGVLIFEGDIVDLHGDELAVMFWYNRFLMVHEPSCGAEREGECITDEFQSSYSQNNVEIIGKVK